MANMLTNRSIVKKCDCWICMTASAENNEASSATRRLYKFETIKYKKKIANRSARADDWRPKIRGSIWLVKSAAMRMAIIGKSPYTKEPKPMLYGLSVDF